MNKEEYKQYLLSPHWVNFKKRYYKKHKKKCRHCGSKTGVQLHHKNYARLHKEKNGDVMPLCRACHLKEHERLSEKRNTKKNKRWMNKPCNVGAWN